MSDFQLVEDQWLDFSFYEPKWGACLRGGGGGGGFIEDGKLVKEIQR